MAERSSMTNNLRPTRAEVIDVANGVLDGKYVILLGAEILLRLFPVETISIVGKICAEAEKVFNQDLYFKKIVKYVGEPMSHLESIASSVVRVAIKVKASAIICFTSSGRAARQSVNNHLQYMVMENRQEASNMFLTWYDKSTFTVKPNQWVDRLVALMDGEHVGHFNLGNPGKFAMIELAEFDF